mgnify:FL=1
MRGKRKIGTFFIITGLLLIVAALSLIGYNLLDNYRAEQAAKHVLTALQEQMADEGVEGNLELSDYILKPDMEMPEVEIDGNYYIGILDMPSLGLSLPIISEWSYPNLRISPCRYSGSAYTGNFTIAGHNYTTAHFGPIRNLAAGDQIIFTDVEGRRFLYEVQVVEILEPTAVEDMLNDEWDLTLFTCTPGGQARTTVRCLKIG